MSEHSVTEEGHCNHDHHGKREDATSDLSAVVEALCRSGNGMVGPVRRDNHDLPLPSSEVVIDSIEAIRSVLFPGYFGLSEISASSMAFHMGSTLDRVQRTMKEQIRRGLCFVCNEFGEHCTVCEVRAKSVTSAFLARLPELQRRLAMDVRASYEGDPAATSPDEAIFCYPGILAITNYRLAHELHRLGVPIIPRIITEHAHRVTGIDIHPGATIGESFFIDHGTGVVIGETCVIGDRVRLYQGVTLGAKSFDLDQEGNPIKGVERHPIVEDDVIIYSGATILGRITIGHGSVIGGNVWLVHSVPSNSRVTQAQSRRDVFEAGGGI